MLLTQAMAWWAGATHAGVDPERGMLYSIYQGQINRRRASNLLSHRQWASSHLGDNHYKQLELRKSAKPASYQLYSTIFLKCSCTKTALSAWGNRVILAPTNKGGFAYSVIRWAYLLTVGAIAVVISVVIALFFGMTAGFFGGMTKYIDAFTDFVMSIPFAYGNHTFGSLGQGIRMNLYLYDEWYRFLMCGLSRTYALDFSKGRRFLFWLLEH